MTHAGLLLLLACSNPPTDDPPPPSTAPALELGGLDLDVAREPGDGRPFVAGERVRLGLRIDGGRPPYTVATSGAVTPASAVLDVAESAEAALAGRIDPSTGSGSRAVVVEVTDSAGSRTTASIAIEVLPLDVVRAGASPAPSIQLVDAAGRVRQRFHWGEEVTVRARLERGTRARLRLWDERGEQLAGAADLALAGGVVEVPIAIPRLAVSGTYGVEVDSEAGARARAVFEVVGQSATPVDTLTVDRLVLRGGTDGRAARAGVIRRGERLAIEARVGGAREQVRGIVRARRGTAVIETALPPVRPTRIGPTTRVLVTGSWQVPKDLPPGRLQLEIEVTEGDLVSTIHRDVLVR
ncbi:MAG TPA: hypothetical protein VML75_17110 [Kofleriaceae bacterium]|nr:hypothetical protein [Kofleriaceae bacterium]